MFVCLFKVLMFQLIAEANSENAARNFRKVTHVVEGVGLLEVMWSRRKKETGWEEQYKAKISVFFTLRSQKGVLNKDNKFIEQF